VSAPPAPFFSVLALQFEFGMTDIQDPDCEDADYFNWFEKQDNRTAGYINCDHFTEQLLKKYPTAFLILYTSRVPTLRA
jgi:hypothetical protein